jgi:hypothetical protein
MGHAVVRMSLEVFIALPDLLVSSYGLKSTTNVTSIVIGNILMNKLSVCLSHKIVMWMINLMILQTLY